MYRTSSIAVAVLLVVLMTACQQMFTSSLATFAARDSYDLSNITTDQAIQLARVATENRDTQLAKDLLPEIADMVQNHPGDEDLLAAATQTAGLATGLSDALADAIDLVGVDFLTSGGSLTAAQETQLVGLLDDVRVSGDALDVFTALNNGSITDLDAAGISAGDFVLAAVALVLGELQTQNFPIENALGGTPTYPDPDGAGPLTFVDFANVALAIDLIQAANAYTPWQDDPLISVASSLFSVLVP